MLITELSFTRKKALAIELRKLIEPDNAQSKRTLKETEIRKYLSKKGLTYYGISDIISVLKSHYSVSTVSRLISKILKPVVWDTCICNLPSQKLTDMLYNSDVDSIITTAVYDELLKLSLSSDKKKHGVDNALDLVQKILGDNESHFCTLVDLPKDTCVNNYVDNQLLWYCKTNDYELYTRDYVLCLRARQNNIKVNIFTSFNKSSIVEYVPNPNGKNVILSSDLIKTVTLKEITDVAKEMGANKFVLSKKFIEDLDDTRNKILNFDLIQFLVNDSEGLYTRFLPEDEIAENIAEIADAYNAVIFSSEIRQCLEYKMNYIPYKLVRSANENVFKTCLSSAFVLSPYYTSDMVYEDNLDENTDDTIEEVKDINTPAIDEQDNTTIKSNEEKSLAVSSALIPHYKPKKSQIPVKSLALTEKLWVLDEKNVELTPDFKRGYIALPGYTVIHVINSLNNTYKLTAYKILNNKTQNYCTKLASITFDKENYTEVVSKDYITFARRAILLT